MEKKLPSVFANKIDRELRNGQELFYSKLENRNEEFIEEVVDSASIEKKINRIFNASDYVYKAPVQIVTDKGTIEKVLIGKTDDSLLTLDNEKILIASIKDIKKL